MINRIIDDPKYAFKNPGNAIQMIHNGEKYIWLHNKFKGNFDGAIIQITDKIEKSETLKNLDEILFILDLKYRVVNFGTSIEDAPKSPILEEDIDYVINKTGIDLTEKNLSEAYAILLSYITQEKKNNPPITKTFFDRLIKQSEHNFRYYIEKREDLKLLDGISPYVVGVGGYEFRDNKLYLTHKLNHYECSFELPALRTDFGTRIPGTKIIYE